MMPGEIISTCVNSKDMDTEIESKARVGRKGEESWTNN